MPYMNKKLTMYKNIPYKNTFVKNLYARDKLIHEKKFSYNRIIIFQNLRSLKRNDIRIIIITLD